MSSEFVIHRSLFAQFAVSCFSCLSWYSSSAHAPNYIMMLCACVKFQGISDGVLMLRDLLFIIVIRIARSHRYKIIAPRTIWDWHVCACANTIKVHNTVWDGLWSWTTGTALASKRRIRGMSARLGNGQSATVIIYISKDPVLRTAGNQHYS